LAFWLCGCFSKGVLALAVFGFEFGFGSTRRFVEMPRLPWLPAVVLTPNVVVEAPVRKQFN